MTLVGPYWPHANLALLHFNVSLLSTFIYVNKLSCTTDEGLTTENFGSYHYTILH